uniref:Uncharacterized protein n=1 Tax=Kwoniella dejecticola CBS 10117 TaxID=1296121 RepID=A0A1A5ZX05_9TREE|nr:uncharacterized protein I303_07101 [Kwoniella dejecticola CBS 10117]OBR82342.1 hypothetical protein I303_07101 [Kwoniella dejecticola CBS 10117]
MPRSRSPSGSREYAKSHRARDRSRDRDGDKERRYKDRSASPYERDRKRSRKRDRGAERDGDGRQSDSGEEGVDLRDMGVKEIDEDDYFLKSNEFKHWLKEEKGKYLHEMSSDSAHKYFRKFVRRFDLHFAFYAFGLLSSSSNADASAQQRNLQRWNDGLLTPDQYHPPSRTKASENTGYKWSFAERGDTASNLSSIRADVQRSTHSSTKPGSSMYLAGPSIGPSRSGPSIGPSIPSSSDRQYGAELAQDARKAERKSHLKDMYNRADELVPKSGGKEGKMEERRAANAENRKFRDKDMTAGLEVDEGTLMGDTGSFAAALRAREQAEARRRDKKDFAMQDRRAADSERLQERKAKENATMDMFKAMARERFG